MYIIYTSYIIVLFSKCKLISYRNSNIQIFQRKARFVPTFNLKTPVYGNFQTRPIRYAVFGLCFHAYEIKKSTCQMFSRHYVKSQSRIFVFNDKSYSMYTLFQALHLLAIWENVLPSTPKFLMSYFRRREVLVAVACGVSFLLCIPYSIQVSKRMAFS